MNFNGKKRYIAGGTVAIGIPAYLLINCFLNMNTTVTANEIQIKNNTIRLEELKELPKQMAEVQTQIENIEEKIDDVKAEQKEIRQDIKTILKAVNE